MEDIKTVLEVNIVHTQKSDRPLVLILSGAAGYIDRIILSSSHMFNNPTCKAVYDTQVPYDPEGKHTR